MGKHERGVHRFHHGARGRSAARPCHERCTPESQNDCPQGRHGDRPHSRIGARRITGPTFDLTIELAELEWENTSAEFYGELLPKSAGQMENLSLNTAILSGGVGGVPLPHPAVTEEAPAPQIPGTGVLRMTGTRFHIPAGLRMNWRTLEPNKRRKSN